MFPDFNIYSTPLLILVVQGLILCSLLFIRYYKKRQISDLLLGLIILITCYHRTTYTIGFMSWYDTYRNTKINYYLINFGMALAPLIYFYVRSITTSDFKFKRNDSLHFLPWILFFSIKVVILIYDSSQNGFENTQNGYLVINFQWKYLDPFVTLFSNCQMLLYLAFTFQHFYQYREKIHHYFSNTFKLELNWIRNFLYLYTFIFIYGITQIYISEFVVDLSWIQKWWLQFVSALIVLYVGVKGYFTDIIKLTSINFEKDKAIVTKPQLDNLNTSLLSKEDEFKKEAITSYFLNEKPYLNPDLNLLELAVQLKMNRAELSEIINTGFHKNFNDYVNSYRVEAFKNMLKDGKHKQLSLLGVAYECGFNSKATFNRVFKKLTNLSPTQYLNTNK